jgi:endoglucanase
VKTTFFGILAIFAFQSQAGPVAANDLFVPSNPPAMKPLAGRDSPAYRAARLFRHGVNLGNYLEVPPGQNWSVDVSAGEFAVMYREGFDHVRVPVGWQFYTGPAPDYALSPEIFSRADFVVTNALANHLAVIINVHGFDSFMTNPAGQADKLLAVWRQVAAHYAKYPDALAFEVLNEPHGTATTEVMNPIYTRAIAEIRKTNPHRTLFVEPGDWGQIGELKNLVLPADDDNLIVSVHCYDPFYFTQQGATWAGPDTKTTGIRFPGPPTVPLVPDPSLKLNRWVLDWISNYNTLPAEKNPSSPMAFEGKIRLAREWSDYYGRPVHVGEFGCYTRADPESRARFYAAFRHALDREKLGWAIWDWTASSLYWDKTNNCPMPGMREGLFGK